MSPSDCVVAKENISHILKVTDVFAIIIKLYATPSKHIEKK